MLVLPARLDCAPRVQPRQSSKNPSRTERAVARDNVEDSTWPRAGLSPSIIDEPDCAQADRGGLVRSSMC